MSYTTYKLSGDLEKKVSDIFDTREEMTAKLNAYCKSIGANNGAVRQGSDVTGFIFEEPTTKPKRWVWDVSVFIEGRKVQSARPQRRSKADKEEWEKLAEFRDNTQAQLKKLFYGDSWGFRPEGTNRYLGIGAKLTEGRYLVESATDAPILEGMVEIMRSEYDEKTNV